MRFFTPKHLDLRVTTKLGTLTLKVPRSATGKDVFDRVVYALGVREFWYFGLSCKDRGGEYAWLDLNTKILLQNIRKKEPLQLRLTLKYYPENVDRVILNVTKHLLYLHLREVIRTESVFCPPEVALVLASYAAQEQYGDYNPSMHQPGSLLSSDFLPARMFLQFKVQDLSLENIVFQLYERRKGKTREAAITTYLSICQSLPMYGLRHFPVTNPHGTTVHLAVDSLGVKFYTTDNPLVPKTAFSLSELRGIKYTQNKVEVTVGGEADQQSFVVFTRDAFLAKRVYLRCLGYRDLYIRGLSEDPNRQSYIVEGGAKNIVDDMSTESKTFDSVAMEKVKVEEAINDRLKRYDTDRRSLCQQLGAMREEVHSLEAELARVEAVQAKTLQQQHKTVRAKGFYDFHTSISAATIPTLARDYYHTHRETQRLSQQASRGSHLLEQLTQATAQARRQQHQLRRQADLGFVTPRELHVFDDGVAENDVCLAKEMEFPIIALEERRQPWAGLTSFTHTHPDTQHELSRISTELYKSVISANQTVVDIHHRMAEEEGVEKYTTIRTLMAIPAPERIRLLYQM